MTLTGRCHCGNLRYELTTQKTPEELPLRACQCGFCRRHGALSTSDPHGHVRITADDPALVSRYLFALRTATFYVCARCGVFIGAALVDGAEAWAIVNAACADSPLPGTPLPMDYGGEDAEARILRRKERWTPARIEVG